MRIAIRILAGVCAVLMTAWVVGAIYYSPIRSENLRLALAGIVVLATALAFFLTRHYRRTFVLYLLSLVNERAHAADRDPAFSQPIREGLPMPPPL